MWIKKEQSDIKKNNQDDSYYNQKVEAKGIYYISTCMIFGVGIGIVIGMFCNNVAIGIAIGSGIGLSIGCILYAIKNSK